MIGALYHVVVVRRVAGRNINREASCLHCLLPEFTDHLDKSAPVTIEFGRVSKVCSGQFRARPASVAKQSELANNKRFWRDS